MVERQSRQYYRSPRVVRRPETFALNEADAEGQRDWSWNDSGLSWSGGEAVDLRIVQNRVPEFDEGSSQSRLLSENLGDAVTETALDLETRTETPCCKEGFGE